MLRFMTEKELADFDTRYQAAKEPTANNLGQNNFDELVKRVADELKKKS